MLLTAIAVLLSCAASSALAADEFATQRESFAKVLKAQSSNRYTLARQLVVGLEEYPLYPYFRYNDLRRRLHRLPEGDVAQFLSAYDNSYLAERLRLEWLRQLARSKRWAMFLRFYRPQTGTKLRCLHLSARIKTGALEGVLADANALWLTGKSQPDECDRAVCDVDVGRDLLTSAIASGRSSPTMAVLAPPMRSYRRYGKCREPGSEPQSPRPIRPAPPGARPQPALLVPSPRHRSFPFAFLAA